MTDDLKVAFPAILRSVGIKRLATEDREARLVLDFRPDEETMTGLIRLSQLEQEVMVGIVPTENNTTTGIHHGNTKRRQRQPEGETEGRPE